MNQPRKTKKMSAENKIADIRLYRGGYNGENESSINTGGGGGGMDNLERRVTALEEDVKVIRNDLTTLMVRSESFATKADISEIRTEMATLRGELKAEMSAQSGELNTALATQSGNLKTELQKAINKQTLLLLTVIPTAFALVTFLFDYFKR
jgi:hypothetical protein